MKAAELQAMADSAPEEDGSRTLPKIVWADDAPAPAAPVSLSDTGVERSVLVDLALKTAFTVPQFNTEWAARQLRLPQHLAAELLEQLRVNHELDVLGQVGPFGFRYSVSQPGRERASRLLEISGYVGPAPVSL